MANTDITQTFNLVADGYDSPALRFFPFVADYLADKLPLKAGDRVLDVGTGTGVMAVACAQGIVPGGRVQAIDMSSRMLDRLQFHMNKNVLVNIDLHEMDAEQLEFRKDHFDIVTGNFILFFLEDMEQSLRGWVDVAKPGATVAFTAFGPNAFQPMVNLFRERYLTMGTGIERDQIFGADRLSDPAECKQVAEAAGLVDVEIETKDMGYHLKGGADDWWEVVWNAGLRGLLDKLPQEKLGQFKLQHLKEVAAVMKDNSYLNIETHFVIGKKPAVNS
ncbi:MAG: methyltransferase domain-containing protein [Proteobacteria bacterium]|nr:methyltransferase domain-containing protein [Pseudomonadota bacterium]